MAISQKLKKFLDESRIRYAAAKHPVVYTAQEIAAAQHIPGRQLAKSVLVKTDSGPALAVLSAVHLIDLKKLKALLRAKKLTIAKEADIKSHFPDMEVGAMSPFGNLYEVPVAVDRPTASRGRQCCSLGARCTSGSPPPRRFAPAPAYRAACSAPARVRTGVDIAAAALPGPIHLIVGPRPV